MKFELDDQFLRHHKTKRSYSERVNKRRATTGAAGAKDPNATRRASATLGVYLRRSFADSLTRARRHDRSSFTRVCKRCLRRINSGATKRGKVGELLFVANGRK